MSVRLELQIDRYTLFLRINLNVRKRQTTWRLNVGILNNKGQNDDAGLDQSSMDAPSCKTNNIIHSPGSFCFVQLFEREFEFVFVVAIIHQ